MNDLSTGPLVLFAFLAALAVLALVAWAVRGPDDGPGEALLRFLLRVYMRLFHGLRRSPPPPADPIPSAGPAIVVANHQSSVDPLVLAACTSRQIRFLMAREYYQLRGLRWLFRVTGSIPVNRDGNDLGATKAAMKVLRDGGVVGIFPQGGIRAAGSVEGKSGVALLALRTGAPVIPAYITGTPATGSVLRAFFTPSRSRVSFGEPMRLGDGAKPSREEINLTARRILERVVELGTAEAADRPAPAARGEG